mmetsp:Transcript_11579/g.18841  ORF Transcript_11579/g.18841 Transcript_11579/m.18841 type:complete len:203 (+) Transcript_11579:1246-1854(+)
MESRSTPVQRIGWNICLNFIDLAVQFKLGFANPVGNSSYCGASIRTVHGGQFALIKPRDQLNVAVDFKAQQCGAIGRNLADRAFPIVNTQQLRVRAGIYALVGQFFNTHGHLARQEAFRVCRFACTWDLARVWRSPLASLDVHPAARATTTPRTTTFTVLLQPTNPSWKPSIQPHRSQLITALAKRIFPTTWKTYDYYADGD